MEREAFQRAALEQLDAVYRLAVHLTRDAQEAEDVVQDVFARALRPRAVASFEARGELDQSMRSWLFTIAHNVFYTRLRQASRRPLSVGDFHGDAAEGPGPDEPPPAWDLASMDWEHVDGAIKRAVESLRPEFREALLLWGVEGLKYREIAEITGVPIGTVMSRLHRARRTLADAIAADGEGPARPRAPMAGAARAADRGGP